MSETTQEKPIEDRRLASQGQKDHLVSLLLQHLSPGMLRKSSTSQFTQNSIKTAVMAACLINNYELLGQLMVAEAMKAREYPERFKSHEYPILLLHAWLMEGLIDCRPYPGYQLLRVKDTMQGGTLRHVFDRMYQHLVLESGFKSGKQLLLRSAGIVTLRDWHGISFSLDIKFSGKRVFGFADIMLEEGPRGPGFVPCINGTTAAEVPFLDWIDMSEPVQDTDFFLARVKPKQEE